MKPNRPVEHGGLTLHALFNTIHSQDGEAGLRHFYNQVCTATPTHLEQLQTMGLLRQPPLDLDASVARHFPEAGKTD